MSAVAVIRVGATDTGGKILVLEFQVGGIETCETRRVQNEIPLSPAAVAGATESIVLVFPVALIELPLFWGGGCRQVTDIGHHIGNRRIIREGRRHTAHLHAVGILGVSPAHPGFKMHELAFEISALLAGQARGVQCQIPGAIGAVAGHASGIECLAFLYVSCPRRCDEEQECNYKTGVLHYSDPLGIALWWANYAHIRRQICCILIIRQYFFSAVVLLGR